MQKKERKEILAISQILILVIGIVAIGYVIGSEVREVKGQPVIPSTGSMEFEGFEGIIIKGGLDRYVPSSIAASPVSTSGIVPLDIATYERAAEKGLLNTLGEYFKNVKGRITESTQGILASAIISLALYFGVRFIAESLFPDWIYTEALSTWGQYAGAGVGIGSGIAWLSNVLLATKISLAAASLAGFAIGTVLFFLRYREEKQEVIIFNCNTWQPEPGGKHCDECGSDGLPCTKYQCMSLGQSCELLNEGTDEEICEWVNPLDTDPPIIKAWDEALKSNYKYVPDAAISPPDRGVIVEYGGTNDGCAPAFSILSFGVELDKPGQCKVSTKREKSFEEMPDLLLTGGLYLFNHSISVSLPSVEALEEAGITAEGSGEHELFVRCESKNGYSNIGNFVFKYCISKEPDTAPPQIVVTNPLNGVPIQSGLSSINTEIYLNEPAECRWSHSDQDFDNMGGTFSCATSVTEFSAQMLYKCSTTLTGLIDNKKNEFYFRCKDQPGADESDRNTNPTSYKYTLIGTRPLVIDSVAPNGTAKGASETVKVTLEARTSAGYDQGRANCYYNEKCYREGGNANNYILFSYEAGTELFSQYQHSQDLWLAEGTYQCSIRCIDLGGNSDTKTTTYKVETDIGGPAISRIYYEGLELKITTDEPADCVYDISGCSYNFEDGIIMKSADDLTHYTDWNTKTNLYIKCKDKYENEPAPNMCSAIIRPIDIY